MTQKISEDNYLTSIMENPIFSSELKKKEGPLEMWKTCRCELYKKSIVIKQGFSNPLIQNIDLSSKLEVNEIPSNVRYQFSIKSHNSTIYFLTENNNIFHQWVDAIRSILLSNRYLTIDEFTIICTLGRGYFGKVLLCEHNITHDVYAIKTVKKARIMNEHKLHTIFAERNILSVSHHPFIVTMYFAFQTDKKFYIGLEYVPGGALFRFLQIGRAMKISEVRFYVAEVALALDYLHSKGILYRDLKLENVLLCQDGHVKLTDFGLSKFVVEKGNYQQTSTFCGTNEYLSPEMISDKPYGFEIDWWTLGVFTYEFLFTETPFYDKNLKKLYNNILTKEPRFPKDTPSVVKNFIRRLLNKDPSKRPTFEELKNDPFFDNINWDDVYNKRLKPPYIPKQVTGGRATNFGEKNRKDRTDSDATSVENISEFDGFSYAGDY